MTYAYAQTLPRKATAEFVGTAFLVAGVVGSGIMAAKLSPDDVGLQLLQNSIATGAILVALILTLQPVSASFNPVITAVEAALGAISWRDAACLSLAQITGGVVGSILANLMFDLSAVSIATTERSGSHLWLAEVVATLGLALIVFGGIRTGRTETIAFAVGGYIAAAYWFTASTSFANPAVTIGRIFSDTFAGIDPTSVPAFLLMQILGGALAYALVRYLYPPFTRSATPSKEATA